MGMGRKKCPHAMAGAEIAKVAKGGGQFLSGSVL